MAKVKAPGNPISKREELIARFKKNSLISNIEVLSATKILDIEETVLDVLIMNAAFSGSVKRGFSQGVTIFAGPSKHFKTLFSLLMVRAYLNKHPDAVCLFVDSEGGAAYKYFKAAGIDLERVVHIPVYSIEEMKNELVTQLNSVAEGEKVIVFVDSVGNLASNKEIEDSLADKNTVDMTRAKAIKSFFRMVTPHFQFKKLPGIFVCHTYLTMEMFSKQIVSGGTGLYYSAQNIFIIGRAQEKKGDELVGWKFTLNVEKSRSVKEKLKFPITVNFDEGISKYSGLLEFAEELGFVTKTAPGRYSRTFVADDKSWTTNQTDSDAFWDPILNDEQFHISLAKHCEVSSGSLVRDESAAEEVEE